MKFVKATPNPSGAYQAAKSIPFPGCLPLTDGQAETLVQHNGFVTITRDPDPDIEGSAVTVKPDLEAWEAWKKAEAAKPKPEPEPTVDSLQKELSLTQAKLDAAIQSNAMLEDCIVEMAGVVYA